MKASKFANLLQSFRYESCLWSFRLISGPLRAYEKFGHPSCSIIFWRPSKQPSREPPSCYVPVGAILILAEPSRNFLRCLLMMNFRNDKRLLTRKKACASTQDLVLATLYVNLDQIRHRSPGGDKIVQRDCPNSDDFASSQYRAASVGFHTALRPHRLP